MKLKDIMPRHNQPKPPFYKKYEDFVSEYAPKINSIEFDENGKIISDQLSVLNFIDFLLKEIEHLPESKKSKKKKKNRKLIKNNNINNKDSGKNYLDYHRRIGNSQDFNSPPYFNQPFSPSSSGSLDNIPNIESQE
ncbi:hypothetical protein [uncultured Draconibacterium sp.]|mgnify:CR=1 FL=1|uniref:hypothetical protein n=1 Tax=uncultured Draconibacterium sp. TaxID=1573823 RepID=UPI0025E6F0EE|nr:hypothetical protein [uncultured Draconibacterium sp.]